MGRWSSLVTLCVAALGGVLICRTPPSAGGDDFVDIFNGTDLTGWVVEGQTTYLDGEVEKPVWYVQDAMIVCAGHKGGFLRYDTELGDFVVHLEYRMSKGCNSGIGIRGIPFTGARSTRPSFAGYEIQIVDDAGKDPGTRSSGSLYRYVAPRVNASKPALEWNVMEIECRGTRIRVTLNDQLIHDLDQTTIEAIKDKPLAGYLSLQNHGRLIEFRNIRLRQL